MDTRQIYQSKTPVLVLDDGRNEMMGSLNRRFFVIRLWHRD